MSRLRHPIRAVREPFGTAGLIVAFVALVAALGGTALAAKGALTAKQKKEVTKIAKRFAGKQGPAGAAGPQGAPGSPGANGKDGANGSNGSNGTDGKSVSVTEIPLEEAECEERGGALVKNEGASEGVEVCSGAEGSPWVAGGNLPEGSTETGSFASQGNAGGAIFTALPFAIPLAAPLDSSHVVVVAPEQTGGAGCTGGTAADPKAEAGFLCVYLGPVEAPRSVVFTHVGDPATGGEGAARTGGDLLVAVHEETEPGVFVPAAGAIVSGTYAVTG